MDLWFIVIVFGRRILEFVLFWEINCLELTGVEQICIMFNLITAMLLLVMIINQGQC